MSYRDEYTLSDEEALGSLCAYLYEYGIQGVNMNGRGNDADSVVDRWFDAVIADAKREAWADWRDMSERAERAEAKLAAVDSTLMALGDARAEKSSQERERSIETKALGDEKKSKLAMNHAWSLRQQADGIWEAANAIRDLTATGQEGDNQ